VLTDAFLEPPLYQDGYARRMGTLYTAAYDVRAVEDVEVPDPVATAERRVAARELVPDVYVHDAQKASALEKAFNEQLNATPLRLSRRGMAWQAGDLFPFGVGAGSPHRRTTLSRKSTAISKAASVPPYVSSEKSFECTGRPSRWITTSHPRRAWLR
jgi:hypothetical protein